MNNGSFAGLPTDLFGSPEGSSLSPAATSKFAPKRGQEPSLGDWGALQLPTQGGSNQKQTASSSNGVPPGSAHRSNGKVSDPFEDLLA